jgi:hypothetical protein
LFLKCVLACITPVIPGRGYPFQGGFFPVVLSGKSQLSAPAQSYRVFRSASCRRKLRRSVYGPGTSPDPYTDRHSAVMRAAVLSRTKRFAQAEKRKERTRKPEVSGSVLSIPFP